MIVLYSFKGMKKLLLISLLFSFSLDSKAQDSIVEYKGLMQCEIKSMTLETIADGKPMVFSSYEDSEKVGDILHFTYNTNKNTKSLLMNLKHPQNENALNWGGLYKMRGLEKNFSNTFTYDDDFDKGSFGKDYIRIKSVTSELRMSRYYKSDWNGIYIRKLIFGKDQGIYYFTLDCRHSSDLIDEVYEMISEWHDEKFPPE